MPVTKRDFSCIYKDLAEKEEKENDREEEINHVL